QAAAREIPDEPRVDRAEGQVAALGADAGSRDLVEEPADLRAREVRVEDQPGLRPHQALQAVGPEPVAQGRCPPALPDDRAMNRPARRPLPYDGGLALVGD